MKFGDIKFGDFIYVGEKVYDDFKGNTAFELIRKNIEVFMSKFYAGDKIIDKIGRAGRILRIQWDPWSMDHEYVIEWDDSGTTGYINVDVGDLSLTLNDGSIGKVTRFTECNHEYIWYHGFNDSFEYCKKCDKKKEYVL